MNKPRTYAPAPVLAPEPPPSPVAVDVSPSSQPVEEPQVLFDTTEPMPEPLAAPPTIDDDLFGGPSAVPEVQPAPAQPAVVQPADDDLFGAPAEAPAADDDLFGSEPAESADDGLFGDPADEPAPMEDDDLFGDEAPEDEAPASDVGADDLFGEPAGAEEPVAEDDDLFGMPAEEEPVETPAVETLETDEDDMFGEPELGSEDDLFGTPESEDAGDLFGDPSEEAPAEEETSEEEDDSLFGGFGMILREPGGIDSGEMRTWVDNTGNFSCQGRIAQVMDGQVQLLKKNGRTSTVPFYRLSRTDLEFVHRQASAQKADTVAKTAAL